MSYRSITSPVEYDQLVKLGTTRESRFLEFKEGYQWQRVPPEEKQKQALELCRDIAQFTNSDGGVLLVGVSERVEPDGARVADEIRPIGDVDGFVGWVETAIRNHLVPAMFGKILVPVPVTSGGDKIVAINIPAHVHLVALWPNVNGHRHAIEYVYRTDHGKAWMNPGEVETHLMDGSRAIRLEAKRIFAATSEPRTVELVPPVSVRLPSVVVAGSHQFQERLATDTELEPRLKEARDDCLALSMTPTAFMFNIPYAFIRGMWITTEGHIGVGLIARVIYTKDSKRPFFLDAL